MFQYTTKKTLSQPKNSICDGHLYFPQIQSGFYWHFVQLVQQSCLFAICVHLSVIQIFTLPIHREGECLNWGKNKLLGQAVSHRPDGNCAVCATLGGDLFCFGFQEIPDIFFRVVRFLSTSHRMLTTECFEVFLFP